VNDILAELTDAGLVRRESWPPSDVYVLNRDHVAAQALELLANQRDELLARIKDRVTTWASPAVAVWLFGSAARGDGGPHSDIDLLVVRGNEIGADDPLWLAQPEELSAQITDWSGNGCELLELTRAELVLALEPDNAAASNAVIAGISSQDAICLKLTGRTTKTDAREAAVKELRGAGSGTSELATALGRLLRMKPNSQCQRASVSAGDAARAVGWAVALVEGAARIVTS
jgi:predicted nucleotidyltransferase